MSVTELAKQIRAALKENFPGVKFSVRSERFSMGSAVRISWSGIPSQKTVESITDGFARVRYCDQTGEILNGGNTYVTAQPEYNSEVKELIHSRMDSEIVENSRDNWRQYNEQYSAIADQLYYESLPKKENKKDKNNNITESPITSENVTINYNEEKNGIELSFPNKPDQVVIDALKVAGFRWSRFNKVWYAKQSQDTIAFAESLLPKQEEEIPVQQTITIVESPATIEPTSIQQSEQTEEEKAQYTADQIIDISADIIHSFNSTMKNMSDDQFSSYVQQLKEQTKQYNITSLVQQIIRENGCQSILDALFFSTRYNKPQDTTQNVIQPSNTSIPITNKNNVVDFSERLKQKEEQKQYIEQRDILINKVLPNLSKEELYQIYSEKDKNKAAELLEHFYMLTLIRENLKE